MLSLHGAVSLKYGRDHDARTSFVIYHMEHDDDWCIIAVEKKETDTSESQIDVAYIKCSCLYLCIAYSSLQSSRMMSLFQYLIVSWSLASICVGTGGWPSSISITRR